MPTIIKDRAIIDSPFAVLDLDSANTEALSEGISEGRRRVDDPLPPMGSGLPWDGDQARMPG